VNAAGRLAFVFPFAALAALSCTRDTGASIAVTLGLVVLSVVVFLAAWKFWRRETM